MRILCVGSRYPPWCTGGYEAIFSQAVAAFRAAGHTVRVLITQPDPSDLASSRPPDPDVHRDLGWYWRDHRFPPIGPRAVVRLERANAAVFDRHVDSFRPDAVVWWSMGGMSLSLLEQGRRAGIPAIGVVGDDWMLYGPVVDRWLAWWRRLPRLAGRAAEQLVGVPAAVRFERAARWIFISEYTRHAAAQDGSKLGDATVAHPGVAADRFRPQPPQPWRWRLLYCGRLDPRKGIDTAIRALAELPPAATLTVDGPGDARHAAELSALAADLGVAARVHFQVTSSEALGDVYAASDAVVFPVTWREPWGLVPLEAMAVGRPVVASTAGGGAAEYLRDGSNCLQFEPGDAPGLAAALTRLADDDDLRAALGMGGHATASQYKAEAFNDQLLQALAAIAST